MYSNIECIHPPTTLINFCQCHPVAGIWCFFRISFYVRKTHDSDVVLQFTIWHLRCNGSLIYAVHTASVVVYVTNCHCRRVASALSTAQHIFQWHILNYKCSLIAFSHSLSHFATKNCRNPLDSFSTQAISGDLLALRFYCCTLIQCLLKKKHKNSSKTFRPEKKNDSDFESHKTCRIPFIAVLCSTISPLMSMNSATFHTKFLANNVIAE